MLDYPPSRSLLHTRRFLRFRHLRSSSRILSLSHSVASYPRSRRLGRSRSASFSPLSLSFSDFPNCLPACPRPLSHPFFLSLPAGNFSVSAARTSGAPSPTISHSPLHAPSLSRIRFRHFIPYLPFSPAPRDALTSSLPFDHNSRLTNIVSTLGAFGGNFGPGASRKVPL